MKHFNKLNMAQMSANPVCQACKKPGETLQVCSGCKVTYYCNTTCQRNHFGIHRNKCGKLKDPSGMTFMKLAYEFAQKILDDDMKIQDLEQRLAQDGSTCLFMVLDPNHLTPDVTIHCVDLKMYCEIRNIEPKDLSSRYCLQANNIW